MQGVQVGPGQLTGAYLVHIGLVLAPPGVGEPAPVPFDAAGLAEGGALVDNAAAPVNHGAEYVENQCLNLR